MSASFRIFAGEVSWCYTGHFEKDHYSLQHSIKGLYTKEEGMQLPMVAIQTAKCKSLLKIATFSISAWAGEDWTFVALWFCVVVKSSGVLGECYLA